MGWNLYTIIGLLLIIVGIIHILAGIIYYEYNISNRNTQGFFVYFLLIAGAIVTTVGGVLLGIGISRNVKYTSEINNVPSYNNPNIAGYTSEINNVPSYNNPNIVNYYPKEYLASQHTLMY